MREEGTWEVTKEWRKDGQRVRGERIRITQCNVVEGMDKEEWEKTKVELDLEELLEVDECIVRACKVA